MKWLACLQLFIYRTTYTTLCPFVSLQEVLKELLSEKLPRLGAHFSSHGVDSGLFSLNWQGEKREATAEFNPTKLERTLERRALSGVIQVVLTCFSFATKNYFRAKNSCGKTLGEGANTGVE